MGSNNSKQCFGCERRRLDNDALEINIKEVVDTIKQILVADDLKEESEKSIQETTPKPVKKLSRREEELARRRRIRKKQISRQRRLLEQNK